MAFKIFKADNAPEGDIKVSIGSTSFRVKDDGPYETDDLAVVETVQTSYSDLFRIEKGDDENDLDPSGEAKALRELHREQEKAKAQHVTKDAADEAAPIPQSVADLNEIKNENADDSKGDKN